MESRDENKSMNNSTKLLLSLLVLPLIGGAILSCHNWTAGNALPNDDEKTVLINLGIENSPLFLRARIWGVAGNHEKIVLSKDKIANKSDDYIFYTSEIFYKVQEDTLTLYAPFSSISEPLIKNKRVIIKELETAEEIKGLDLNYKKYGLTRISGYD